MRIQRNPYQLFSAAHSISAVKLTIKRCPVQVQKVTVCKATEGQSPLPQETTSDGIETFESDQPLERKVSKKTYKTCSEAILTGVQLFQDKAYSEALEVLTEALELPGQGRYRFAGRAKEFSGPSTIEENAALYNMACCYSKLTEFDSAMTCLEQLLESGFDDYETLRTDPDLEEVRSGDERFMQTISRFDSIPSKLSKFVRRTREKGPNKT